jgi:DNA-binding MarR family transcriptional regulator
MEQEISVIKYLVALRNCSKQTLPMSDSLVAYDLILFIAIHCGERQPLSVKQLFSSLPHSYSAVREHYNRLLNDGYVVHKQDEKDKRIKYIEPTEKFIGSVVNYANNAKAILDTPPSAFQHVFSLATLSYSRVKTTNYIH